MSAVVPLEECHLPALVELVNAHLALVPPVAGRVTSEALHTIIAFYELLWAHHYPDARLASSSTSALTFVEDEKPLGLLLLRPDVLELEEEDFAEEGCGEVALLLFAPDRLDVGAQLLEEAESILGAAGCTCIELSGRCPIGIGWSGFPETWHHVVAALESAGYECFDGWIILTGRTDRMSHFHRLFLPPCTCCSPITPTGREWRLEVYNSEQFAAECEARGVPPHLEGCPGFEDWIVVEWIGVDEEFRGKASATGS